MSDPYQTPDSDVSVPETISKTKWKIFFGFLLSLQLVSIALGAIDDTETLVDLVIDTVIYSVILLGIFGYAFDRRIFPQKLWRPIVPAAIVYDVYYIFIDDPWAFESSEEMYFVMGVFAVVFLPLMYFQYLALFRYAFRADEVWKQGES